MVLIVDGSQSPNKSPSRCSAPFPQFYLIDLAARRKPPYQLQGLTSRLTCCFGYNFSSLVGRKARNDFLPHSLGVPASITQCSRRFAIKLFITRRANRTDLLRQKIRC